ncbi:MAG: DegT/DnrJ/EryC1/StrS family aminotransferase [Pirellulaceae bacterium]
MTTSPTHSCPAAAPWPFFSDDEIATAERVLRSGKVNYLTGEEGRLFEQEFAEYVGTKHAIALANGTLALELALQVLGIGAGDEVVVTPRSFIASASCVVTRGATPVFADVDADSQSINAESIRRVLTPRTRAIIAVHLAGWPCDMDPIMQLAEEHGLYVIEDCAQAHGARYRGRPVGSIGHFGAFSFCQDKILTTAGEGGMLVLNDRKWWEQAWSYKDHGKSFEAVYEREYPFGFRWLHESFGTNWRLTELQSAIGRVILRKLDQWVQTRRCHSHRLLDVSRQSRALRATVPAEDVYHSYYKYYTFIRPEKLRKGWDRDRICQEVIAAGVPCFSGSCSEIYLEKAFPPEMRPLQPLPVAHELGKNSVMLLVHPTLSDEFIEHAATTLADVVARATEPTAN